MKKVLNCCLILTIISVICIGESVKAMPNPWIDCGDDISCGAKKAGFNFPLRVKKYSVRAMDGLMEIKFPLDKKRTVTVRKAVEYKGAGGENGIQDISGDYNNYKFNEPVRLNNGVLFDVRGNNKNKFYVANFAAESGYYSFYCSEGMKMNDLKYFYKILEEAEAPRMNFSETEKNTIEKLAESRTVDSIVEPVYTQDCFPRTLQKKGVSKECFDRANLGDDKYCSASEIKMIKEYYKKGQNKDPLNDCSGKFCAEE